MIIKIFYVNYLHAAFNDVGTVFKDLLAENVSVLIATANYYYRREYCKTSDTTTITFCLYCIYIIIIIIFLSRTRVQKKRYSCVYNKYIRYVCCSVCVFTGAL